MVHVRWMIRKDMPMVLETENKSFEWPCSEEEFIRCLRQRNCIGMVAEINDTVVAYMIYELHKNRLHVLSFAVHPDHRRKGVASAMAKNLIGKLTPDRRNRITLEVRETNLDAQLFWKAMGFKATQVLKGFYQETKEDAYLMVYRCNAPAADAVDCVFGEC